MFLLQSVVQTERLAIILMSSVLFSIVHVLKGYGYIMNTFFTTWHVMFATRFSNLVKFGPHSLYSIILWPPSGLISQDQDDSQIYEVILTVVYVKQIISCDEWVALVMKLHQP